MILHLDHGVDGYRQFLKVKALPRYEMEDVTEGAKTLACAGNACELN